MHIVEFRRYIDYAEEEKIKFGQVIYVNNSIQNITDRYLVLYLGLENYTQKCVNIMYHYVKFEVLI